MAPSSRHHYVPETLMKPWAISEGKLRGYKWDVWKDRLRSKELGPKAFCCEPDLLTVSSGAVSPDIIETDFFGPVDSRGAEARDKMLTSGIQALSDIEKSDFIRLLLSLDVRRPEWVSKLRAGGQKLKEALNADVEVQTLASRYGITSSPADWFEDRTGVLYEDEALGLIQNLSDNPQVGNILMRCRWGLRKFSREEGELILSDRPLIRCGGTYTGNFLWLLPLSPLHLLCISPLPHVMQHFFGSAGKRIVNETNITGVLQSDTWVFSRRIHKDSDWLAKRLRQRAILTASSSVVSRPR